MPSMILEPEDTSRLRSLYADEITGLRRRAARRRIARRLAAAALSACLALGAGTAALSWRGIASPAHTPTTIALGDGIRVALDAGSLIEVPVLPWRHRVRLRQGAALFEVEHDDSREFIVEAAGTETVDRGTRFLVEGDDAAAVIAVFEGKVEVVNPAGGRREVAQGNAVRAAAGSVFSQAMPDEAEAAAWRQGRVVFRVVTLDRVAQRLSRYGNRPVVLGDPALAALKVSGTFRIDDGDGAVATLERALPIRARREADRVVLLPR